MYSARGRPQALARASTVSRSTGSRRTARRFLVVVISDAPEYAGNRVEVVDMDPELIGDDLFVFAVERVANETDYESTFLNKSNTNARDGKTVYIRPEFHEKLTRIIQVIGEDKISIYAYLDNLLDCHFQEFSEQITKSYNDKYKPI